MRRREIGRFACLTVVLLATWAPPASALSYTFVWSGDTPWANFQAWSPNGIPAASTDTVLLQCNASGANRQVSNPIGDISRLWIDTNSQCNMMTLVQTGGTFGSERVYIGDDYRGTYSQLDGTANFDWIYVGFEAAGDGTYQLSGSGSSVVNAQNMRVGYNGDGVFVHDDGFVVIDAELCVGCLSGSDGEYQAINSADLDVQTILVGEAGVGSFVQDEAWWEHSAAGSPWAFSLARPAPMTSMVRRPSLVYSSRTLPV
jgi:T5SS/PEP-CTERM-associated repeat protein